MVRHSHHHVPAHVGGIRYVPPCCGCGGIDRRKVQREEATKELQRKAGIEKFQQMQQAQQQEQVPQHVRDMAGIKLKQQLAQDTFQFAQVIQQKGISKEKALEKLLDKLVSMYTSEKELMKALKNMDFNKLLALLKKLLAQTSETETDKDTDTRKKVEKSGKKAKIHKKNKEDDKDKEKKQDSEDDQEEKPESKNKELTTKSANKDTEKHEDSFKINQEQQEIKTEQTDKQLKHKDNQQLKIEIDEGNLKLNGSSYSLKAINLLKEQEELELNAIRRKTIYNEQNQKETSTDPKNTNDESEYNKQKIDELEKENEKLKKIILELQQERRNKLIENLTKPGGETDK